jgi:hypothetical protein
MAPAGKKKDPRRGGDPFFTQRASREKKIPGGVGEPSGPVENPVRTLSPAGAKLLSRGWVTIFFSIDDPRNS